MLSPSRVARALYRRAMAARELMHRQTFPFAVRQAWDRVEQEQLSYLSNAQLLQLLSSVRKTASSNALIIEAGCARGGSAILMCAMKSKDRHLKVYDVFDMIPPPSEHDGEDMRLRYAEIAAGKATGLNGGRYYLYEDDMLGMVKGNFERLGYAIEQYNVELIKGKVQDTLVVDEPVALAHIDVDWYEPVTACLERIMPHLIVGGSLAVHAYSDWSGSRKAVTDYFNRVGRDGLTFDSSARHLFITRSS